MYRIETVVFKANGKGAVRAFTNNWEKLLLGFRRSAQANTDAEIKVHEIPDLRTSTRVELATNHYKLKKWREIVYKATCPVVLSDADICFLGDIEDGFTDHPITLTARSQRWCNAGVVFVRPGQEANDFFDRWCEMDDWLHQGERDSKGNPIRLKQAWQETGIKGHNQTALAKIKDEFTFGWVPGKTYNASLRSEWKGNPKVVHVKDSLRIDVLSGRTKSKHEIIKKILPYYSAHPPS
jgi:hypothetical protein